MSGTLVPFLGLALAVAGCTKLGPDFSTPPVPEPESWIESDNPKLKSEPAETGSWWTVFDDPASNRLIEIATDDNLSLQVAGIRILEARARLGIAVGEQYPQVQETSGEVSHNTVSDNAPNTAGLNRSFQNASVGFDASWELDFWGRLQRGPDDYVPAAIQDKMRARTNWGDIIPPSDLEKVPRGGDEVNLEEIEFRRPDW